MKTIQLTNEQYHALMQGESVTIEPPKPKAEKWQPKGGEWFVNARGEIERLPTEQVTREFGVEYQTKEQAEKARNAMRKYNRLLAWLAENDDGWVADWDNDDQEKWSVRYHHTSKSYETVYNYTIRSLGSVYMSQASAEKLRKLLND